MKHREVSLLARRRFKGFAGPFEQAFGRKLSEFWDVKSHACVEAGFDVVRFEATVVTRAGPMLMTVEWEWGKDARRLIEAIMAADTEIQGELARRE